MGSKKMVVLAGHLVLFAVLYFGTWGLSRLIGGGVSLALVVEQPLFWGLMIAAAAMHPLLGIGKRKPARAAGR